MAISRSTYLNKVKKYFEKLGYLAGVVERRIIAPNKKFGSFSKDLFGFVDLLVVDPCSGKYLLVQVTSSRYGKAHRDKMENTHEFCTLANTPNTRIILALCRKGESIIEFEEWKGDDWWHVEIEK